LFRAEGADDRAVAPAPKLPEPPGLLSVTVPVFDGVKEGAPAEAIENVLEVGRLRLAIWRSERRSERRYEWRYQWRKDTAKTVTLENTRKASFLVYLVVSSLRESTDSRTVVPKICFVRRLEDVLLKIQRREVE